MCWSENDDCKVFKKFCLQKYDGNIEISGEGRKVM